MRSEIFLLLSLGLAPAFALGEVVKCVDSGHSVELTAKLAKHRAGVSDIRIKSGDKTKTVKKEDVTRIRSTASEFYMLFKVQTKNGREELELETHFAKGATKSSAGSLTNKSENSEKVLVSCTFT